MNWKEWHQCCVMLLKKHEERLSCSRIRIDSRSQSEETEPRYTRYLPTFQRLLDIGKSSRSTMLAATPLRNYVALYVKDARGKSVLDYVRSEGQGCRLAMVDLDSGRNLKDHDWPVNLKTSSRLLSYCFRRHQQLPNPLGHEESLRLLKLRLGGPLGFVSCRLHGFCMFLFVISIFFIFVQSNSP